MLAVPLAPAGSTTLLESETGSGKTEAALAHFLRLFEAGLVDGLYFALPTRSAATQMHRRITAAARQAFEQPPPVVLAVPGYLRVDDMQGRRLAPFEVLWLDSNEERVRHRAWASENSKRYLAGTIVVGTVDQILLSSLAVSHAHLRATTLLRQLLVVDEIHASDTYMGRILEDVLTRHARSGGHALLLSATLGGEARARLLNPAGRHTRPTLPEAVATPYPLVSHAGGGARPTVVCHDAPARIVRIEPRPWTSDPSPIATAAVAAAERGAKVLVIRNTVVDCVNTQHALEQEARARGRADLLFTCEGVPAPHHARFASDDRHALDEHLEARIGRSRGRGGCVVIATQTVQQSLDIDADLLVSDLCPVDVLLQRIGRLHRHHRPRPDGFADPVTIVTVPSERDLGTLIGPKGIARSGHGIGTVYPDLRVLEATWRLVERRREWRIPTDNRLLVEHGVHSEVLADIVREGGSKWQNHGIQIDGSTRGMARSAELNLVDWSLPYYDTAFPESGDQRISTRLGEGDRRVVIQEAPPGPFGKTVRELALRADWVAGVPSDVEFAERLEASGESIAFWFGHRRFVYDRFGLRPYQQTLQDEAADDGP